MSNPLPPPGLFHPCSDLGLLQAAHMMGGKANISVVEQDFGQATAKATKVIDGADVDGEILAALFIMTEAAAGSTNAGQTWLAKAAAGTTLMTGKTAEFAVTEDVGKNVLNAVMGVGQSATEANRQFEKGEDVYVYTEAETSRSAGKYFVVVLWKER